MFSIWRCKMVTVIYAKFYVKKIHQITSTLTSFQINKFGTWWIVSVKGCLRSCDRGLWRYIRQRGWEPLMFWQMFAVAFEEVSLCIMPSSGCLVFCLCLSVLTLLLQSLWVPPEIPKDEPAGRSPEEQGNSHAHGHTMLSLEVDLFLAGTKASAFLMAKMVKTSMYLHTNIIIFEMNKLN